MKNADPGDDDPPGASLKILVAYTSVANETTPTHSGHAFRTECDDLTETATAVFEALTEAGHDVTLTPLVNDPREIFRGERAAPDLVFNLVDSISQNDEREAEFPEFLAREKIPFTGCSAEALKVANRKDDIRKRLSKAKVPVPFGAIIAKSDANWRAAFQSTQGEFDQPLFVKPARTDGSVGISQRSVVVDETALKAQVQALFLEVTDVVVVERYLPGPELNVAILPTTKGPQIAVTAMDFDDHPPGAWPIITYDCKWVTTSPEYVGGSVAASLKASSEMVDAARALGIAAAKAVDARGPVRVDLRANEQGQLFVIDVNPNPDLHPDAGYAHALAGAGIPYPVLVRHLVETAWAEAQEARHAHSRRTRFH